jgi:hypothetical protein
MALSSWDAVHRGFHDRQAKSFVDGRKHKEVREVVNGRQIRDRQITHKPHGRSDAETIDFGHEIA